MDNLPRHIVIVPDGNRRWAKRKKRPAFWGHRQGAKALEEICRAALDLKIPYLTVWGTSVANVTERSSAEVGFLMRLFETYFKKLAVNKEVHQNRIRLRILGRWAELFPASTAKAAREAMKATEKYEDRHLTMLMAYSGVDEMTAAVRATVESAQRTPKLSVEPATVKAHLWTHDLPPVDLVIRTGGEPHWSAGMMMWDVAEARLHFTETFWPDFSPKEFKKVLEEYSRTERRFGK